MVIISVLAYEGYKIRYKPKTAKNINKDSKKAPNLSFAYNQRQCFIP